MVFFYPNVLGHPDNYIPANPLVTPAHISYLSGIYYHFMLSLRSIPDKLGGVLTMGAAILIMLTIPLLTVQRFVVPYFRPIYTKIFWFFAADYLILMWIGQNVVESPYVKLVKLQQQFYFAYFIGCNPILRTFLSVIY